MKRLLGVLFLIACICAAVFGLASLDKEDLTKAHQAARYAGNEKLIPSAKAEMMLGPAAEVLKITGSRIEKIAVNTVPSLVYVRALSGLPEEQLIKNSEKISDYYATLGLELEREGVGFFINEQGLILTPLHTILMAAAIQVRTWDGKIYRANLISADVSTNIAVLKIPISGTRAVRWGDSNSLALGQSLILLGADALTNGRIIQGTMSSALRDSSAVDEGFVSHFFLVDNESPALKAGWAVLNTAGEVVGMLSQTCANLNISIGENLAISSNQLASVTKSLAEGNQIVRPYFGLQIQPMTTDLQEAFNLKSIKGALVSEVEINSPAGLAGILAGDVIKKINDSQVDTPSQVRAVVMELNVGEQAQVTIERKGETKLFFLAPSRHPMQLEINLLMAESKELLKTSIRQSLLEGIEVENIKNISASAETDISQKGLGIQRINHLIVHPSIPLESGMRILEVNGVSVSTQSEFQAAKLKTVDHETIILRIETRGKKRFMTIKRNP